MSISIIGIIAVATGALLNTSFTAYTETTQRSIQQREGVVAMDRIRNGLRRSNFVFAPNYHDPSSSELIFSGHSNNDGDSYLGDSLFPRIDEDVSHDLTADNANGISGRDDDGDGQVDERAAASVWSSTDQFDTTGFDNSNGNKAWPADWVESIESDGATAGVVQVAVGPGMDGYSLRLGGDVVSMSGTLASRSVDVGAANGIWLSYIYSQSGPVSGTVTIAVLDSVGSWEDVATHNVGGFVQGKVQSIDLAGDLGTTSSIRFTGSGTTGSTGYIYFDDIRLRTTIDGTSGSMTSDDDEDGASDEDPIDGIDNDLDGMIDEDPPSDANNDSMPGVSGIDDDGDGAIDEGSAADDDEDGSVSEQVVKTLTYFRDDATNTLRETDSSTGLTTTIAEGVSDFQLEFDSSTRVTVTLELTDADGHVLEIVEAVCLRNVLQNAGKRVR